MVLEGYENFSEKFEKFRLILAEYNRKYNLTAISDEKRSILSTFSTV